MITPVNGHLLIEPLKHESFIPSQKETYEEIGTVVDADPNIIIDGFNEPVPKGIKVYFDSWLAVKYPKGEGDEYYWLVKWEHVRAIERD